ncbi:MAG: hypothetical protein J6V88_04815 [Kiritimatiellae bacterium]|nr:hypothetical protein [Kiritimatiellia bacterium]
MKLKSMLLLTAAIGSFMTFADIRAVSAIQWPNGESSWQYKRHLTKLEEIKALKPQVVFIGDSITHFFEGRSQWKRFFPNALNLGFSADRTEHVLWRIKNGELDGYEAKCIVLMIGTNNTGHFPIANETPADTIQGIKKVLRAIREKQPKAKIVLHPIFPRATLPTDQARVRNAVVNREIVKFADGVNIFWCDFNNQFLTSDGKLALEIFPDKLHPNDLGYEIWAAAVKPYIDYALSDGKLPAPGNRYASFVQNNTMHVDEEKHTYPYSKISNGGWCDNLLSIRNEIAASNGEFDIVFLGDSITQNWKYKGYGASVLDEIKKTYSVLNLGYGGDGIEHVLWRAKYGELYGYRAKCVMLMIGTNHTGREKPESMAKGIQCILNTIKEKQPTAKIILLPIFPRGESANDKNRVKNENVNKIIKTFADEKTIFWIDFNDKLVDENGNTKKYMPDLLHPREEGYKIWRDAVAPKIKEIVGK